MSAYLIAHIQVTDAAGFDAYRSAVPAVIRNSAAAIWCAAAASRSWKATG